MKDIVNKLAEIKAAISNLEEQESVLRDILVKSGETSIKGDLHKVAIVYASRKTTDWKGVVANAGVAQALIDAFTKETPTVTVRLSAL